MIVERFEEFERVRDAYALLRDPRRRAAELLASLADFDESLCGTYRFGTYLDGTRNIGTLTFEVERAAPDSGAVYIFDNSEGL